MTDIVKSYQSPPSLLGFHLSDAFYRFLMGPMGSGKSTACAIEIGRRSVAQAPGPDGVRRSRWVVVRNTLQQLMDTTFKTWCMWYPPGIAGEWRVSDRTFVLRFDDVIAEVLFRPLDRPEDVQRLLSLEATGAWINEFREIPLEIVNAMAGRVGRFPGAEDGGASWRGIIGDTNPPGIGSAWHEFLTDNLPGNARFFRQPSALEPNAENLEWLNQTPDSMKLTLAERREVGMGYYRNLMAGASDDFIRVYVKGQFGRNLSGLAVYEKSFSEREGFSHVSKIALEPIPGQTYPVIIGLDFGRKPAAIFGQRDGRGKMRILDELTAVNMGIEQFLATMIKPLLYSRFADNWIIVAPDPSGLDKGEVVEKSAVDILKDSGLPVVPPGSNLLGPRIQAVESWLMRQVDGEPAIVIDPRCRRLIEGFRGEYRFASKPSGSPMAVDEKPEKNLWSHPHDALQYLCMVADGRYISAKRFRRRHRETVLSSAAGWT